MAIVNEFRSELLNRLKLTALDNDGFEEELFFEEVSELLQNAGILDNIEYAPYRNSNKGMRLDGYSWNELEKTISIIIVHYSGDETTPILNQNEISKVSNRVSRFVEKLDNKDFLIDLEVSSDRLVADQLISYLEGAHKIRIVIYSDHELSNRVNKIPSKSILGKPATIELWAIDRIESLSKAEGEGEDFVVDFVKLCGGLDALPANTSEHLTKTYLCVVPGNVLSDLYDEYGQRLLEANVRTFLDFRSGVNKGIRKALVTEPDNFFAYNNGLTCTATDIEILEVNGKTTIQSLSNLQIVNGGQTTASIYFSPKEKGGVGDHLYKDIDLNKVFVQMKLTVISNPDILDDMKSKISEFANTQNTIQKSDLVSNHPFHRNIEKLALSTPMPAVRNGVSTKWFYERSRGQYNTRLRALTPAKQRQFQAEFPVSQKFSKTDMAKYENTWRMRPFEVKKGAQANLKLLGTKIAEEYDRDEEDFKQVFYRDLIAKAILFKEADSAIFTSHWYREHSGLKAETVTYTIAYLRHILLRSGNDINLDRIYRAQTISENLSAEIVNLGLFIRSKIQDPVFCKGVTNPSEFCKSQKGWELIKDLDYIVKYLSPADILSSNQIREGNAIKEEIKDAGRQINNYEMLLKITPKEWIAISRFYGSQGYPPFHKYVALPIKCSSARDGKFVPSEAEMKAALEARNKAYELGFDFAD